MNENYILSTIENLMLYEPSNLKTRYGNHGDGGYVLVEDYQYDYYLGCGIGYDLSFERDFLNKNKNINGSLYDGTINYTVNISNNILYYKKNISSNNTEETTNLNLETENYKNIFLKMDIEASEWNWIKSFDNFNRIKQFVIEIHGLFDERWIKYGNYSYEDLINGLKKINKTHYLVHFHSNSGAEYISYKDKKYPTVAELTYIRKNDSNINGLNKKILPIKDLDYKNSFDREDLEFDFYPFVSNS